MSNTKGSIICLILSLLLVGCGDQKIDTRKAREEMEAREIKRVTEGQIVEKALSMGNQLAQEMEITKDGQGAFLLRQESKLAYAHDLVAFDEIEKFKGKTLQVFSAYAYSAEHNIPSEASVQLLENGKEVLYAKPAFFQELPVGIIFINFPKKEIVLAIKE
jgi:hypothetical protein